MTTNSSFGFDLMRRKSSEITKIWKNWLQIWKISANIKNEKQNVYTLYDNP